MYSGVCLPTPNLRVLHVGLHVCLRIKLHNNLGQVKARFMQVCLNYTYKEKKLPYSSIKAKMIKFIMHKHSQQEL